MSPVCNKAEFFSRQTRKVSSNLSCTAIISPPTPPPQSLPQPPPPLSLLPNLYDPSSFKKTVSLSEASKGDILQFTLETSNMGESSAFNVTWSENQPIYIDYVLGSTRFELYDKNKMLKFSGNANDPEFFDNGDGSTILIFGNIVPEIGPSETLKIFYKSRVSDNVHTGSTLQSTANIESYFDEKGRVYTYGASASTSMSIVEKSPISTIRKVFSIEPLAFNSIHNCCIPNRQEAYELLSGAKKKGLFTDEIERNLREADSLLERAKEFYYGGNYITANNHAQKACEIYRKAIGMLRKILESYIYT
jgi:uncharacterized repeat protein (TIGR01451 family)